jgi:hypothetical protein
MTHNIFKNLAIFAMGAAFNNYYNGSDMQTVVLIIAALISCGCYFLFKKYEKPN